MSCATVVLDVKATDRLLKHDNSIVAIWGRRL
jgi:hypothetical protein